MTAPIQPTRSWLFALGARPERFAKATEVDADVLIIDLEDAVALADKPEGLRDGARLPGAEPRQSRPGEDREPGSHPDPGAGSFQRRRLPGDGFRRLGRVYRRRRTSRSRRIAANSSRDKKSNLGSRAVG